MLSFDSALANLEGAQPPNLPMPVGFLATALRAPRDELSLPLSPPSDQAPIREHA
jgi:hypothetical protein